MSSIKILHIANDYTGTRVYQNLIKQLDFFGVNQLVYTPLRSKSQINKFSFDFQCSESRIYYRDILTFFDRILFGRKIFKIYKDITSNALIEKVDLIHSHTWYSDGSVAYEIYKKYKIPYIIAVRNTDLNLFFKYMLHLRKYGLEILENAQKIVFISPVYRDRLFCLLSNRSDLLEKSVIIPNGIDPYWIENVNRKKDKLSNHVNLLYVGEFTKGKNVFRLIKSVERLIAEGFICTLHLVGGGGGEVGNILKYIRGKSHFVFYGKILDRDRLLNIFRSCDIFTMPSKAETFGLVYIEALSQGLPILYTVNEGIYGYYDNLIGEAVDCNSIDDIVEGIKSIIVDFDKYRFDIEDILRNHDWRNISLDYLRTYNVILKNDTHC